MEIEDKIEDFRSFLFDWSEGKWSQMYQLSQTGIVTDIDQLTDEINHLTSDTEVNNH